MKQTAQLYKLFVKCKDIIEKIISTNLLFPNNTRWYIDKILMESSMRAIMCNNLSLFSCFEKTIIFYLPSLQPLVYSNLNNWERNRRKDIQWVLYKRFLSHLHLIEVVDLGEPKLCESNYVHQLIFICMLCKAKLLLGIITAALNLNNWGRGRWIQWVF